VPPLLEAAPEAVLLSLPRLEVPRLEVPVLEVLVLEVLVPEVLVPEVLVPEVPVLFELPPTAAPSAGTELVALRRPDTAPVTMDRPGRALAAPLRALVALFVLVAGEPPPVTSDEPQDAPVAPASAELAEPTRGTPAGRAPGRSHRSPAADPPRTCVIPGSDVVGVAPRDTDCASAGAATPTVRMLAEATPPSKIRQLYTKGSTSSWGMELPAIWEFTSGEN
jgi:hypothetical protein